MNSGESGSFTRLTHDACSYRVDLQQSTSPLKYAMYSGKFENNSKCVHDSDSFYHPFDNVIVDMESELKGITRAHSRCPSRKYSPTCGKSKVCTSTFHPSVPIVMAHEACPIVHNNIPKISAHAHAMASINTNVVSAVTHHPRLYGNHIAH